MPPAAPVVHALELARGLAAALDAASPDPTTRLLSLVEDPEGPFSLAWRAFARALHDPELMDGIGGRVRLPDGSVDRVVGASVVAHNLRSSLAVSSPDDVDHVVALLEEWSRPGEVVLVERDGRLGTAGGIALHPESQHVVDLVRRLGSRDPGERG